MTWIVEDVLIDTPSILINNDNTKRLQVILLDGSPRMNLYRDDILQNILIPFFKNINNIHTCYLVISYGKYKMKTVFFGYDGQEALTLIEKYQFENGEDLVHNSLYEGLAAVLSTCKSIDLSLETHRHILIITSTLFDTKRHVKSCQPFMNLNMEALLREFKNCSFEILFHNPSMGMTKELYELLLLSTPHMGNEVKMTEAFTGWYSCISASKNRTTMSRSSSGGSENNLESLEGEAALNHLLGPGSGSPLDVAVRQFLSSLLKLPQTQRADAIKRHLESPQFSGEYKQTVISMIKQMQSAAKNARQTSSISMTQGRSMPTSPIMPHPNSRNRTPTPPLWMGRLSMSGNGLSESFIDIMAVAIPNPKSQMPSMTPPSTGYILETWPLVLSIVNYVSIRSPAVSKIVPIACLVEILPIDGPGNAENLTSFKNMLSGRQVVGLAQLGGGNLMLIAARPNQLVGMLIAKNAGNREAPSPLLTPQKSPMLAPAPPRRYSTRSSVNLPSPTAMTPDAILKQHRSGMASVQSASSEDLSPYTTTNNTTNSQGNNDVFNSLMASQMMSYENVNDPSDMDDMLVFPASKEGQENLFDF